VAYVNGSTLYVTSQQGNTVRVISSAASAVTKTVTSTVADIHPGETVTVTGSVGKNGSISAEAIKVGAAGAGSARGEGKGRKRALEALLGSGG
jgi:DNA-binding beta-propeller fold protein YncE